MKNKKNNIVSASLNGVRSSPRKMRLVVNLIRYKNVQEALDLLKYSSKCKVSIYIIKLILSLLSNWNKKKYIEKPMRDNTNSPSSTENLLSSLYIKDIRVNQGKTLKRLRPVPQGRGHRIRKRSSNVVIYLEKK